MTPALPDHSPLGASGMYRWMKCSGSAQGVIWPGEEASSYAKEGTAAHKLAQDCLTNDQDAWEYIGKDIEDD